MNADFYSRNERESTGWFSEKIQYKGIGRASFPSSGAIIEGLAEVEINELGDQLIKLTPENLFIDSIKIDQPTGFDFVAILKGVSLQRGQKERILPIGIHQASCDSFIIETDNGVFRSISSMNPSFSFDMSADKVSEIKFECLFSEFTSTLIAEPRYLCIPLTNFIFDFSLYSEELKLHSLKFERGIDESHWDFTKKNLSLPFYISQRKIFIAKLQDYSIREEKIVTGRKRCDFTAIAVGEIPAVFDFDDPRSISKFSSVLGNLLGFIIGSNVGTPWVEFLSEEKKVVKRVHVSNFDMPYRKGRKIFTSVTSQSVSDFLTCSFAYNQIYNDEINVLFRHLIELNILGTLDGKMALIVRIFEGLFRETGIGKVRLLDGLMTSEKNEVIEIIKDAVGKLFGLVKKNKSNSRQVKFIEQIMERVRNAPNLEDAFGIALPKLIEHFGLEDAFVLEKDYSKTHSRIEYDSWSKTLSLFRRTVIHSGYFRFSQSNIDIDEAWNVINHLHDLLVRIVFRKIGFSGNYQPLVSIYQVTDKNVDWVNQQTSIEELGFQVR